MKLKWLLTLLIAFVYHVSFSQQKTITGTVSEGGIPLPGVSVVIDGTSFGTQTGLDGDYSIQAKQGDVLVFSFIGTVTQKVKIGASNTINVNMETESSVLDDLVVTGYAKENKSKVTGAVSVVRAETIENVAFTSFEQILQGQAAGVQVMAGTGQPGTAANVRIRGANSINGSTAPLYILDGFPISASDFAGLNSNDFENVSVLKDASATSKYGSRASNGVIVITTKQGKFKEKTKFTYRSQFGITEPGNPNFEMMNTSQMLTFQRMLGTGYGAGVSNLYGTSAGATGIPMSDAEIAQIAAVNDIKWTDVFFRTGITQSHELGMRGGSDRTRFYTSLNYFKQDGIALNSDLQRFNLRTNLENRATDNTTIGYNINLGYVQQNYMTTEGGVYLNNPFAAAYLAMPYHPLYRADGNIDARTGNLGANSYEDLMKNGRSKDQVKITAGIYGETKLHKNVTARVDFGIDYSSDRTVSYRDPNTFYGASVSNGQRGTYGEAHYNYVNINNLTRITYDKTFNDKHDVSFGAYLEYYKFHSNRGAFNGYGINSQLPGYAAGITPGSPSNYIPIVSGAVVDRGLFSYFALAKYSFDDKYTIDASIRRDASSRFSDKNKWGTFWSIGANWNIINESFMESQSIFQDLKFRASIGTTGNQAGIGDFQQYATWGATSYGGASGTVQTTVPNPELKWEESKKINFGLDFAVFNRRITGTVEAYANLTNNLLISQRLPLESGREYLDVNAGKMENKGIDLSLEGFIVKKEDISFSLYANANYNKNEITSLGSVNEYELGTSIVRVGSALGSHFAVGWAGVNPANGQPLYYDLDGNVTTQYSDSNSTANHGSYIPVYTGGFGHRFKYKNFDFSSLFTFAAEYDRFNNQTFFSENHNFAGNYNLSTNMLNMWQQPGDITEVQSSRFNREFSSKDIEDASYLRLRNVEIGYNFTNKLLGNIKQIDGFRIYIQAQNLVTWTKFSGFDPEDDNNVAQYEYPTPKIFTMGVNLNF